MSFGPPPSPYTQSAVAADQARRRRRIRLLSGAVAVLLAVALGVGGRLLLSSSADDGARADDKATAAQRPDEVRTTVEEIPASPEGQQAIEHYAEHLEKNTDTNPRYAPGSWATDKIFARGVADRVEGYRIKPHYDETAWTLELGGHICATSRHVTADGRTAVVVQPPRSDGSPDRGVCDQVVFFDLNTGRKLWQEKMPAAGFAYVTNTNLTLTEGVVAVAWGHGSVAYDMKSGKRLWNTTTTARCEDKGFAGGRALLAVVGCGAAPDTTFEVQKLDPRTGRTEWTYKVARGVDKVFLPSSDPPVLAVAAGDIEVTDLITLDGRGRHLATVSLNGYDAECGTRYYSKPFFGVVENCDGVVVGRTRAYVMSKENIASGQPSDWIVAFDTTTGRTAGKFEGREFQRVYPLRASGDDLLIYRAGAEPIAPAALVRWNPRTDEETPLLLFALPEDDEGELSDPQRTDVVVEHGSVFFAPRELARDDDAPKSKVLMAIGYTSAGLTH
ncbi:PQQ-binding-like beta-propeller repeat protein [Streptomyces sp. NPDC015220]|uniref:outer membrane protein assembly factor BamB family protein n=1 Tax=Streptomyces sp. NPDC015220 TaxID=3364947 RepID=UPI0036F5AB8F